MRLISFCCKDRDSGEHPFLTYCLKKSKNIEELRMNKRCSMIICSIFLTPMKTHIFYHILENRSHKLKHQAHESITTVLCRWQEFVNPISCLIARYASLVEGIACFCGVGNAKDSLVQLRHQTFRELSHKVLPGTLNRSCLAPWNLLWRFVT